jgi:hypothetical protein
MMSNQELGAAIKKHPVSFTCVVLSVVMIGLIYFRHGSLAETEQLLEQKTAESEKIALNIANSAQLKEQLEAIEAANKQIAARAIQARDLGGNTKYFYTLESNTGVKMIDLRQTTPATVPKPAKGSFLPGVGFSVSAQSDLKRLINFLRQIENGEHYARVLTATCSANTADRNAPLTLALTLELLGTP